jgi:hypothetical protein
MKNIKDKILGDLIWNEDSWHYSSIIKLSTDQEVKFLVNPEDENLNLVLKKARNVIKYFQKHEEKCRENVAIKLLIDYNDT